MIVARKHKQKTGLLAFAASFSLVLSSLLIAGNQPEVQAAVVSDEIFSCGSCDYQVYGLPTSDASQVSYRDPIINSVSIDMLRSVTPAVKFNYTVNGNDDGSWDYINISAALVSPSGQLLPLYVSKRVLKKYDRLGCDSYNYCYLWATVGGNLPLGAESGSWTLRLSFSWANYERVGSVTNSVQMKKDISFSDALIVAATSAPVTTTASPEVASTALVSKRDVVTSAKIRRFAVLAVAQKTARVPKGAKVSIRVSEISADRCNVYGSVLTVRGTGRCGLTIKIREASGRVSKTEWYMNLNGVPLLK